MSKVSKGFHKLRGMKRPKMKNFNFMKKLNKTTKTKRKKKHFSKNFKGKVIDGVHELYTLTAGIMLGIRYTVRVWFMVICTGIIILVLIVCLPPERFHAYGLSDLFEPAQYF